jgi:hypothetical protein
VNVSSEGFQSMCRKAESVIVLLENNKKYKGIEWFEEIKKK